MKNNSLLTAWQEARLKRKIEYFLLCVVLIILASVFFDVWIAKYSLFDFYNILEENNCVNELVTSMEQEKAVFEKYVRTSVHDGTDTEELSNAFTRTKEAVNNLPFDYSKIGAQRYALVWSINNSYEVYCSARDALLETCVKDSSYIKDLYMVYEMQDYLISYIRELMNLTLEAGDASYSSTLPNLMLVPALVFLVALTLMVATISLATIMNKALLHPIDELVRASKRIANNDFFIDDVVIDNKDEMGELAHAFNKMKFATGEYINGLEEKRRTFDRLHEEELSRIEMERQLQNMKFDVLKNQVNPHFLFNTLNVISGMAKLEDAAVTDKMISSLSNLFRYNLKTQSQVVPLAQEIKVVNDYMYLQQMRFGERITYSIDCDMDVELVMIPPFTLQPLVENSIIHGLSLKEEGGHIGITIHEKDEYIHIVVKDSGVGMSEDELDGLIQNLKDSDEKKYQGIGLWNIKNRIEALYKNGSFTVKSSQNEGTVIEILIPLFENEMENFK